MNCTILQGDALELLRTLPPESVHTCVTSPPYYNLRDYGVEGQIGNEGSVEEYLQALVAVFREVRRVLHPNGTLWVNVGDSYATNSGNQPPTNTRNSCGHTAKRVPQGYKKKDLIGIPWQLAFALRADGWYLRQDIIWQKPNCMEVSLTNNGAVPREKITEGGGLSMLRQRIEEAGGKMEVWSSPRFQLMLSLPEQEEAAHESDDR